MFKFKIVYKKDKNGNETYEVEVQFEQPSLNKSVAAQKLGISPSQILSITKR
jgi:hypothetical protein